MNVYGFICCHDNRPFLLFSLENLQQKTSAFASQVYEQGLTDSGHVVDMLCLDASRQQNHLCCAAGLGTIFGIDLRAGMVVWTMKQEHEKGGCSLKDLDGCGLERYGVLRGVALKPLVGMDWRTSEGVAWKTLEGVALRDVGSWGCGHCSKVGMAYRSVLGVATALRWVWLPHARSVTGVVTSCGCDEPVAKFVWLPAHIQ